MTNPQTTPINDNFKNLLFAYPQIVFNGPTEELHSNGELLLALINFAYYVGKNSVTIFKENEDNSIEIYDHIREKHFIGGSPKSIVEALIIALLNYHLGISCDD